MSKKLFITGLVLVFSLLLAACSSASGTLPETGGTQAPLDYTDLPAPAQAVVDQLGNQLGIPVDQIQVTEVTPVEWPDSCLGLGRADEGCLQVITQGFRVVAQVGDQQYIFHTDETGVSIRENTDQ